MQYKKKPVVIEALQWDGNNTRAVLEFMGQDINTSCSQMACDRFDQYCDTVRAEGLPVETLEDGKEGQAKHIASVGDFIIKGVQGEFYPCKPDIFALTYDEVI